MKKTISKITSVVLAAGILLSLSVCACAENAADAVETIMTAGTTQAFTDEAVPEEDIRTILSAGLASESAINQQPWFFVAVTDRDVMAELAGGGGMPTGGADEASSGGGMPTGDANEASSGGDMPAAPQGGETPSFPQGGGMPGAANGGSAKAALGDSPLAIIVYMDKSSASPDPSFDCGLAVQNMYIAAASLGYGVKIISSPTMTLNGANHDQLCEKLGVDASMTAVAVLLVGKTDDGVDGASGASTRASLDEKTAIIG